VDLDVVLAGRDTPSLPLSLTIGAWLVRDGSFPVRAAAGVGADESPAACAAFGRDRCAGWLPRVAMLVLGDGSACRSERAPGYLDPRAEPFDAATRKAFQDADTDALMALDPLLAKELMVAGRPAWQVLAGAAAGTRWWGNVVYDAAPYGVNYTVAVWER
jgi:hypothetical protein